MPQLAAWDSFYVIVGSAAGALIGLQFVVMTLIAERPATPEAGAAFGTPTIVHFSVALLLSALLRAPWPTITPAAVLWGLIGFSGAAYTVIVARRMRAQTVYPPDFEDWLQQLLVNHAHDLQRENELLTSLFKPMSTELWQGDGNRAATARRSLRRQMETARFAAGSGRIEEPQRASALGSSTHSLPGIPENRYGVPRVLIPLGRGAILNASRRFGDRS
jgi:hypothetical protein